MHNHVLSLKSMKTKLTLLILLSLGLECPARISTAWNYDQLNEKATLIVIATPTKVSATDEQAALPNIQTVRPDGKKENVLAKGVETTFEILAVLKGERDTKLLKLHHYALSGPKEASFGGGPGLVSFEPKSKKRYLMFLISE